MKSTAKKNTQKVNATANTTAEGRKENKMKFDINAHNNNAIIEHADGSREAITAEDMKVKAFCRYNAEKVATLRKWAKARGIADADSMKKKDIVFALVEDDTTPKEEKAAAKTARKEAAQKKEATAKKEAKAKKDAPKKEKKEKKDSAQKPKKEAKKEDAQKMDSVKTSWEKEDARIVCAMDVANMQNEEIADALNRQKTLKLYEAKGADSMKDFVENKCRTEEDMREGKKGKYHGMSYSSVNQYINAHNYVYSMKDADGYTIFSTYGMHLIQALIVPCHYHAEAVREAVKEGRIKASMSLEALKKIINDEEWKSPKKEAAEAKKPTAEAEDSEEAATASTLPKTEKHNGVTDEEAEAAAAILSAFIDEANMPKEKKEAAEKALMVLQKRADI